MHTIINSTIWLTARLRYINNRCSIKRCSMKWPQKHNLDNTALDKTYVSIICSNCTASTNIAFIDQRKPTVVKFPKLPSFPKYFTGQYLRLLNQEKQILQCFIQSELMFLGGWSSFSWTSTDTHKQDKQHTPKCSARVNISIEAIKFFCFQWNPTTL